MRTSIAQLNGNRIADLADLAAGGADVADIDQRHALGSMDPWQLLDRAVDIVAQANRIIARQEIRIAQLEELSASDELTGLLNRRGLLQALGQVLDLAKRQGGEGVVVFIDLDGFKSVNDSFGHAAGDAVLRKTAAVISGFLRKSDITGRLGGDEFVAVFVQSDEIRARRRAGELADLLNSEFADHLGRHIPLRASLGIMPYQAGDNANDLLRQADALMYQDKISRRCGK